MAIVREASRERGTIVEGKARAALGELQLSLKGVDLSPEADRLLLCLRKVYTHRDEMRRGLSGIDEEGDWE